jgi:hypothetical protein
MAGTPKRAGRKGRRGEDLLRGADLLTIECEHLFGRQCRLVYNSCDVERIGYSHGSEDGARKRPEAPRSAIHHTRNQNDSKQPVPKIVATVVLETYRAAQFLLG